MYAYPVHSSVPAPRTAARASWKSAASGCLAGVMAPFMVLCLCLYGGWQLRPVFPCPTLPQACLSVCLHTKFGSGPCLGAAPAG